MAAQKGKDMLLKLDDGSGAFVSIAGLRTQRFALNADPVDVTNQESAGRWRELLARLTPASRARACSRTMRPI
jgi:TP901-1 family phage major tail protein